MIPALGSPIARSRLIYSGLHQEIKMGLVEVDRQLVESIKADIRNWLASYMQGTPERLQPVEVMAEAIALEQLSQEIRGQVSSKILSFSLTD
jgi:hypothetical protein